MNESRNRAPSPPPPLGAFAPSEQVDPEVHERETVPAPPPTPRQLQAAFAEPEPGRDDPTPLYVPRRGADDDRDTVPRIVSGFAPAGRGLDAWPESLDLRAPAAPDVLEPAPEPAAVSLEAVDLSVEIEVEEPVPVAESVEADGVDADVHERVTVRPPTTTGVDAVASVATDALADTGEPEPDEPATARASDPPARREPPSSLSPAELAADEPARPGRGWGTAAALGAALLLGAAAWLLMVPRGKAPVEAPARDLEPAVVTTTPAPPTPPPAPVEIDEVPVEAVPAPARRRRPREEASADAKNLPQTPERSELVAALATVRAEVAACRRERSGVAEVELIISGTGSVVHARVVGDFAGTPEGSCVARAVRKAQVPPFKQERLRILYPFTL